MKGKHWMCSAIGLLALAGCGDRDEGPVARYGGLQTAIYGVADLAEAREWYAEALGVAPYYNESFYVGFNVGGYELGLDPKQAAAEPDGGGVVAYWAVEDIEAEYQRLLDLGARPRRPVSSVGGDIKVASVLDPFGNPLGLIYNPHFEVD